MPAQLFDSRELPYRAGGIRQRVVQKLEKSFEHSDPIHQREIWEKSLEDVAEGHAVGPFYEGRGGVYPRDPVLDRNAPLPPVCGLTRYGIVY